jgi:hypothetical protein
MKAGLPIGLVAALIFLIPIGSSYAQQANTATATRNVDQLAISRVVENILAQNNADAISSLSNSSVRFTEQRRKFIGFRTH